MPRPTAAAAHVVVVGGGLAGTLAAAALAPHAGRVTVVERDRLPDAPEPRRGLPQARHAHLFWSGGARAVEALLPGTHELWERHGARHILIPQGMVSYSPAGWFRRWPDERSHHYAIAARRDLTDWGVRTRLTRTFGHVEFRTDRTPVALLGDSRRVRGLEVRDAEGRPETLEAALVVDATGRAAVGGSLLAALGAPPVPVTRVDAGVAYASRLYRAPEGAGADWPVVNIQADPTTGEPAGLATVVPTETGDWLVSLSGTRGRHPTGDGAAFEEFARTLRHPLAADLVRRATPVGAVALTRSTPNIRRHYDRVATPAGFLAVGDAATACNPVYAHGMSSAARSALALRRVADELAVADEQFGRRAQKAVAREAAAAWTLATGQDLFFPGVEAPAPPGFAARAAGRYVAALMNAAIGDHHVVQRFTDVMTLEKPATRLATPRMALAALRGPRLPKLDGPALTPDEQAVLDSVRRTDPPAK
ncbi:pyridine nucleotide-disulfide oxidoreductase [Streptomyces sp. NPDC002734]|uniref:NAD(P)/FAD-dependent oxidoreductase n=1 Tax=Streptomyces sp. NPDC002734 TaxID=3154426 RepID=UPI003321BF76